MARAGVKVTTVTEQLIKERSGEFDIGCIQQLELAKIGLQDLGCIDECTSLSHLDLSYNRISSIRALRELKFLESLNLSSNNLSVLNGLEEIENLSSLNVAGNMIMSLDTLHCLSKLDKLTSLRLQDKINKLSNPVCQTQQRYKRTICNILPQLKTLDGERVSGKGSDLFWLCDDIEAALNENAVSISDTFALKSSPWPLDKVLTQNQKIDRKVEEAEQNFKDILAQCKEQNENAKKAVLNTTDAFWCKE